MEELMRFELMCIFCDTLFGLVALHQPRSVLSDEEIEQVISSFLIGSGMFLCWSAVGVLFVYVDNLMWHFCDIFDTSWAIFGLNISNQKLLMKETHLREKSAHCPYVILCVNCYRGSWHICGRPSPGLISSTTSLADIQMGPFHFKWQCQSEQHLPDNWGWIQWSNFISRYNLIQWHFVKPKYLVLCVIYTLAALLIKIPFTASNLNW